MKFATRELNRQRTAAGALFGTSKLMSDGKHLVQPQLNFYEGFRAEAASFFEQRGIAWHKEHAHILSSQACCVNSLFPFVDNPAAAIHWIRELYPDAAEMLPIESSCEPQLPFGSSPYLTFEWIGERNHLLERGWGRRGQYCTSVDAMLRFRTATGKIHVVLTEWKYTEAYDPRTCLRFSDRGTDRLRIYERQLELPGCQLQFTFKRFEDLFFNPYDQLMRNQLLASAMERTQELGAHTVSVLFVSPRANEALTGVADYWRQVAVPSRFHSIPSEELLPLLIKASADPCWSKYVADRYITEARQATYAG